MLVTGLLAAASVAALDTPLEEIVVTATLRDATVLEVPASLTVLNPQTLQDAGEQHFEDVLGLVPNLNWSSASSRPRYFQIRGIGERSQYQGAPNPSVGFLVDDVDFSAVGMVATLFDVEQVEVLRGPQGTRYGANALAGLISVRSRAPSDTFTARTEFSLGSDDWRDAGVVLSAPISERLAWRFAIQQHESNGFRDNVFLGRDDTNGRDELTARGKLAWTPGEHWEIDATLMHVNADNGYDAFTIDNDLTVESDKPGKDSQRSDALSLRARWTAPTRFDVLSISSVADSDIEASFDGDWGNDGFWALQAPEYDDRYDFTSATLRDRSTLSQEVRLLSKPGAEIFAGRAAWLVGVYGLRLEEENDQEDFFNGFLFNALTSNYDATNLAVFGQMDWALSDRASIKGGLRAERRSARYRDSNGIAESPNESMWGGEISWLYELSDARSAYVRLSRGYKAGGFNIGLAVPADRVQFDTETLWNLESGVRGAFADGRGSAGLSVFYAWRKDMQVNTSFQSDPTDPLTFTFFTDNAASGTNYGIEAEGEYRIDDRWRVFGTLGLLATELDDYVAGTRVLDGREQAHAPSYTFSLGAEFASAKGWFARADLIGSDAFFFSDSHDQVSEAYQLLNLKLGYRAQRWQIDAWGRNLTDEVYATRGFFFGNEPPDFPDRLYVQRGAPRHYGVTFRYQFD